MLFEVYDVDADGFVSSSDLTLIYQQLLPEYMDSKFIRQIAIQKIEETAKMDPIRGLTRLEFNQVQCTTPVAYLRSPDDHSCRCG